MDIKIDHASVAHEETVVLQSLRTCNTCGSRLLERCGSWKTHLHAFDKRIGLVEVDAALEDLRLCGKGALFFEGTRFGGIYENMT